MGKIQGVRYAVLAFVEANPGVTRSEVTNRLANEGWSKPAVETSFMMWLNLGRIKMVAPITEPKYELATR